MRIWARFALTISAAGLFAGCGGSQSPIGAPGAMPQSRAIATRAARGESWMLPEARKVKELLYVSDDATRFVYVYNYKTGVEVGQLQGFAIPRGQCVDKKGDVWITDFDGGSVIEFAHGGNTSIKSLSVDGFSSGCSVAPNGDLAVSNTYAASSGKIGNVEVWSSASGSPRLYKNKYCPTPLSPGYDDKGNLYVESATPVGPHANVCKLRKGDHQLALIPVGQEVGAAGGVQWDGSSLTLTDTNYNGNATTAIYRTEETPSGLVIRSTTILTAPCDNGGTSIAQPFIVGAKNTPANRVQGDAVIGSNSLCSSGLAYWSYPEGGDPILTPSPAPSQPEGESVSIAK
jgi:hypothetical protein